MIYLTSPDQVTDESSQNPADSSPSQDQCVLCGVVIGPQDPEAPADGGGGSEFLRYVFYSGTVRTRRDPGDTVGPF